MRAINPWAPISLLHPSSKFSQQTYYCPFHAHVLLCIEGVTDTQRRSPNGIILPQILQMLLFEGMGCSVIALHTIISSKFADTGVASQQALSGKSPNYSKAALLHRLPEMYAILGLCPWVLHEMENASPWMG